MVLTTNHISGGGYRPSVRFSSQPPSVYSGSVSSVAYSQPSMMGGSSSKSIFSFPQINLSGWFATPEGAFVLRILISFAILGVLGWVLHKWFKNRLLTDAGYQPNCPTWLMGSPIPGTCSVGGGKKENFEEDSDDESESDSDEETNKKTTQKNQKKLTKKPIKKNGKEGFKAKQQRKERFEVLGKPRADEQGGRDVQSYTQLRSSYGRKEIPHEYATCLTTNPDNKQTCDFWKNLDAEPRPVRKMMRANDYHDIKPVSNTYPMYEENIPMAMSSSGGFGNFAAVNFSH